MESKNTIKKCWCGGEWLKRELKKRKKYGLVWEENPERCDRVWQNGVK